MPEDEAVPQPGTPEAGEESQPAGNQPDAAEPQIDTEKWIERERYQNLEQDHSRYTGLGAYDDLAAKAQLADALQSDDPDVRSQALAYLGIELQAEEDDADDDAPYLTREEFEAFQAEQQQERQTEAQSSADWGDFVEKLEALEEKEGRQFASQEAIEDLLVLSDAHRDSQGKRDVEGAYKRLLAAQEGLRAPKAKAAKPPGGKPAKATYEPGDDEARRNQLVKDVEAVG